MGLGTGLLHKRLIQIIGMINIVFQLEQPLDWGSQKLRMTKPVSNILIFVFRFNVDIVFVPFSTEMLGDWPVPSLVLPLCDMFKIILLIERGIGNKPILIGKSECHIFFRVGACETDILKFRLSNTIGIKISMQTRCSPLVWPL